MSGTNLCRAEFFEVANCVVFVALYADLLWGFESLFCFVFAVIGKRGCLA